MDLKILEQPKSDTYQLKPTKTAKIHHDFIGGMVIFQDEILSSSEDGALMRTHSANLEDKRKPLGLNKAINHLALSEDASLMALACDDKKIRLIDTTTWQLVKEWKAHDSYVTKVAFTENKLISISHDATAKIWDYEQGKLLHKLEGHEHWVYTQACSPDGSKVLTTSNNCSVKVWNIDTGVEIKTLVAPSQLVYASDGMSLIVGGTNKTGIGNKGFPNASLWAENGLVYTCSRDIVCWDSTDWSIKWQVDISYDSIKGIVYIPQYNLLIAVSDAIYGINPQTGALEFAQKNIDAVPMNSCTLVQEDYLVTGDEKGNISIWEISELIAAGQKVSFGGDIHKPMFVRAANRLIGGSWLGGQATIWSAEGQLLQSFNGFPANRDNYPMSTIPKEPHKVIMTGESSLKIIDVKLARIVGEIILDLVNLTVTEIIWINEVEFIASCVSASPRLINIETKELKIIDCKFSLGGNNHRLSEDLFLFQLAYFQSYSRNPAETARADFAWEVGLDKTEAILKVQAPLIVFNFKTKKIEQEWWFPHDQVKDTWGSYAWPIVGGVNNQLLAASYLKEKVIYFWELGKEVPAQIHDMAAYAKGSYSSVYGAYADENQLLFSVDGQFLRYDILKEKWATTKIKASRYTFHHQKGWLVGLQADRILVIWDLNRMKKILEFNLGAAVNWALAEDYIYVFSKEKGMLVYRIV